MVGNNSYFSKLLKAGNSAVSRQLPDTPPPPYTESAPDTGATKTPDDAALLDGQTRPAIAGGRWDLACNIDVHGEHLLLDATGAPVWSQDTIERYS